MNALLKKLNVANVNPGACCGPDGWITDPNGARLASIDPASGNAIGDVVLATTDTYNTVAQSAVESFLSLIHI